MSQAFLKRTEKLSPVDGLKVWICFETLVVLKLHLEKLVEHGVSNAKIMGSIPRESKSW